MKNRFYFIHIPKCGGTSFIDVLQRNFSPLYRRTHPGNRYADRIENVTWETRAPAIEKILKGRPDIRCFAGHTLTFDVPECDGYNNVFITFVRKPIRRVISNYFFCKNQVDFPVPSYWRKKRAYARNHSILPWVQRFYGNGEGLDLDVQFNFLKCLHDDLSDEQFLDWLQGLLDSEKLVMLPLEQFDECSLILETLFPDDFIDCTYEIQNKSRYDQDLDPREIEEIEKAIDVDNRLYEMAVNNLAGLIKKHFPGTEDYQRALEVFKLRNAMLKRSPKETRQTVEIFQEVKRFQPVLNQRRSDIEDTLAEDKPFSDLELLFQHSRMLSEWLMHAVPVVNKKANDLAAALAGKVEAGRVRGVERLIRAEFAEHLYEPRMLDRRTSGNKQIRIVMPRTMEIRQFVHWAGLLLRDIDQFDARLTIIETNPRLTHIYRGLVDAVDFSGGTFTADEVGLLLEQIGFSPDSDSVVFCLSDLLAPGNKNVRMLAQNLGLNTAYMVLDPRVKLLDSKALDTICRKYTPLSLPYIFLPRTIAFDQVRAVLKKLKVDRPDVIPVVLEPANELADQYPTDVIVYPVSRADMMRANFDESIHDLFDPAGCKGIYLFTDGLLDNSNQKMADHLASLFNAPITHLKTDNVIMGGAG